MTPFQVAGITVCVLFALGSALRVAGARPRWPAVLATALGLLGAVTIRDPDMTTRWARVVGITRGADLLLYLMALAFLGSWFYFYQKLRLMSNDITALVRALALRDAPPSPPGSDGATGP